MCHRLKPNSVEPPWYGPVCPVVWEGWRREASPYPDQAPLCALADYAQITSAEAYFLKRIRAIAPGAEALLYA